MSVIPTIQTPLVVGNWKMHGLTEATRNLLTTVLLTYDHCGNIVICPPFTALGPVGNALETTQIKLGAQDCHHKDNGAYTGDISVAMLDNIGCHYCIVGHSERRKFHHESDAVIAKKVESLIDHKVIAIVCIGETEEEREAGKTLQRVEEQLLACLPKNVSPENTIVAYEPIWAIGSGKTPTTQEIDEVHTFITQYTTQKIGQPLLSIYGGSVKSSNASSIMSLNSVSGVLVGGASLNTVEFSSIIDIAQLIRERKKK